MYKRILLAYDGSKSGQKALLDGMDLAQWSHAELVLIAVMPLQMDLVAVEGGIYDTGILEQEKKLHQAVLDEGLAQLKNAGYPAAGELLIGETVTELSKYARKMAADLIVVGHKHQDSWAKRWWRGSVSGSLIQHAPCSVLVAVIP